MGTGASPEINNPTVIIAESYIEASLSTETREAISKQIKEFDGKFLDLMQKRLSDEQLQSIFSSPELTKYFLWISNSTGLQSYVPEDSYKNWPKRDSITIDSTNNYDAEVKQVTETIKAMGLEDIAKALFSKVTIVELHHDFRGRRPRKTGELLINVDKGMKELPSLLLHEIGHAIHDKLATMPEGKNLFDRYALELALRGNPNSTYAYTQRIRFKDTGLKWPYPQKRYFEESFAEDFRIYMLKPEAVGDEIKAIFDEIVEVTIEKEKIDDIRSQTSSAIGTLYGKSPNDLIKELDVEEAKDMARKKSRKADLTWREAMKKYSKTPTKPI